MVADAIANGELVYHQHVTHRTSFSHHNFEILLTFTMVYASVTSRKGQKWEFDGNIDTTTNRFNELRKNRSQNVCFSTKTKTTAGIGPLFDSKGPNLE